jgi:hypothetical protein
VALPAQVQNSQAAAQRTPPNGAGNEGTHLGKGRLPRRDPASLGCLRLPAQLQVNLGSDDKRGKVPLFSLANLPVEALLRPSAVRERSSAGRKKAGKVLPRLGRNNANLI